MKKQRFVNRETYLCPASSWHCKEMGWFLNTLAGFKSGIGRKTLKGALSVKSHRRSTEGHLVVLYVFPMETSEAQLKAAMAAYNGANDAKGESHATYTFLAHEGRPTRRVLALHLMSWDLAA